MDEIIEKCVKMVDAAGGRVTMDASDPAHREIIDGVTLAMRTTLVHKHQIVIKVDQITRKPVEIYRNSTTAPTMTPAQKTVVPQVASVAPVAAAFPAPAPKTGAAHTFVKPPFFDEIQAMMMAGKDWTTEKSVNLLFVGPKGCVIGSTKIRIRKVDNGFTPILTVKD